MKLLPRRRNEDTVHVTVVGEPDKEFLFQVYDLMTRQMPQRTPGGARVTSEEYDASAYETREALQ